MNLQDTLYNWLSIKKVSEERPNDQAARETLEFFEEILRDDHQVQDIEIFVEAPFYILHFEVGMEVKKQRFPIELIDSLNDSIKAEPKYNLD